MIRSICRSSYKASTRAIVIYSTLDPDLPQPHEAASFKEDSDKKHIKYKHHVTNYNVKQSAHTVMTLLRIYQAIFSYAIFNFFLSQDNTMSCPINYK